MKYILSILLLGLLFSCDNTFEIIEEPKDIPIVYGILSATDTAHYIRVERAFVDAEISANELAQRPDSLYYPNAIVSLIDSDGTEFQLDRIDATLDGFPRQEGAFAQTPNILYKIKNSDILLKEGERYTLEIDRQMESLPIVRANTVIIDESLIRSPQNVLNFDPERFTAFTWREGDEAVIFDLFLDFNYRERVRNSGDPYAPKSVRWQVASDIEAVKIDVPGINFFAFLAGAIEIDDSVERIFENIDLELISGGEEIKEYIRIGEANLGITSSQDVPTYTNLSEGRGLFSSLYREVKENISLTNTSLDSLKEGSITGALNFE